MKNLKYWIEKKCEICGKDFWSLIKRNGRYCSNDCSSKATANNKGRLDKIRKTKLERYGNETYVNPDKAKQTCLEKYGVDNVSKSQGVIDKIKQVNMERYGVEYSWQADVVKEKIKSTNLERYGTENPSQSSFVKDKKIKTFFKKYGVSNPFQSTEIIKKYRQKYKEKFGSEYPSQIEEIRKKIQSTVRKNNYNMLFTSQRGMSKVDILFSEDEYINSSYRFKYKVKCHQCGNIFEDHFDGNGHPRCLICHPNMAGFSLSEIEIVDYIKSLVGDKIEIRCKDRSVLKNRELDIYIPEYKIAIEYNGLFWHSELGGCKDKNYHLNKLDRCNQQGINLITIFEDEWCERKNIVKSKLRHLLMKNISNKVYARKCEIKEISGKYSNIFLNQYHLQGTCVSKVNLGLFYNNELVAVMTFGKPRIIMGFKSEDPGKYELLRYATSQTIIGGASKLFSYFIKIYNPSNIISYADRRWSNGHLYDVLKFNTKEISVPSFWYFKPGYVIRYHKFGFRKSVLHKKLELFIPELTEWENMQLNGWDRIWDCGNLKYEWNKAYSLSS